MKINKVIITDDHALVSSGIASLINSLPEYEVIEECRHGKELVDCLANRSTLPDIVLLDINMPVMNGFETMEILRATYPDLPVLALSINDDEDSILRMLRLGVKGYVLKDTDSEELFNAMNAILTEGFYFSKLVNASLLVSLRSPGTEKSSAPFLKERELEFLHLAATDLTYVQIAEKMFLSPKTVDHYREALFEKFEVKSRVGLVIFALKQGLLKLD
jgi:DNA-binding NarL/FixJ family response regulator